MIDPYERHPEIKIDPKKEKIRLTKRAVLLILKEEVERIIRHPSPTWGWTRDDMLQVIDNIEEKIENYDV